MTRSYVSVMCALFVCLVSVQATHAVTVEVYTFNFDFSINPQGQSIVDAVINAGDTIRWVRTQGGHTTTSVTGSSEVWNADLTSSSPTFERVFNNPGVFVYYCIPHGVDNGNGTASGMAGTITVLPVGTGACCLAGGTCSVLTAANCQAQGGTYQGNGTTCTPNPCAGITGACCLNNGTCVEVTSADCALQGGTYQGDNTMCSMVSCPIVLTPYLDALPLPGVAQPTSGVPGGAAHYEIAMTEQMQQFHTQLPMSRTWGYNGSYPGPTIEARRNMPVTVRWTNDLRVWETGQLRTVHALPVDTCLHGPDETGDSPVAIVHLHGGKVAMESDGYPEWSFPPGQQSPIYTYPNDQRAATVWYHDHALGITRLNVMMGMAGFYLIRDDDEDALNIPRGEFEVPLAIQDRSFNLDGSLRYPAMWHDHFFGDFMVANGKVWPYFNVKQGKYRFRIVNGCTSRALTLALSNGATFWQIGSDLGLLEAPLAMSSVTITPGERADLVMDFGPYAAGTEIILTNSAPIMFPGTPGNGVIPNVMKFIVQGQPGDTDPLPNSLVAVPRIPEWLAVRQRDLQLQLASNTMCPEHMDPVWTIDGMLWHDITEFPRLNETEIWAWRNRSSVTHPMHMHLVAFQVLDRQEFNVVTGEPIGDRFPPELNEMGWKDTVQCPPGQITRVIATFAGFTGLFPYHCHILEHEDHEMMRQFSVRPACPADIAPLGGDETVGVPDLLAVINSWGPCPPLTACRADLVVNQVVGVPDLLFVINNWGPCPDE